MGWAFEIPWIGVQHTMDKCCGIPWEGGPNTMLIGPNTMRRGFDLPWVRGSKYHGWGIDIPWIGGSIYHGHDIHHAIIGVLTYHGKGIKYYG